MKPLVYAVTAAIIIAEILVKSESKEAKGACFKRYFKDNGCKKLIKINSGSSSTFEECCGGGGAGWSLTRRDRKTCTSCKNAEPKDRKGVCFNKFSKKSGCRHYIQTNGRKTGTIEECCRGGGAGWSRRKSDRNICRSCDTVDTSFWGDWDKWSECSATCGQPFQQRQRKCINAKGKPSCRGNGMEKRRCKKLHPCPVDGGWNEWSPWSSCSVSCGKGSKLQKRACANPIPMYGGKECQGQFENWSDCELQKHCPIDGGWGEWSSWGECSQTCDLGTKKRNRKCDFPKPKYGGKQCLDTERIGTDYCREERCQTPICDERSEECASGSGSGWNIGSGSGSGESSGESSGFGSGYGSGEGSGGKIYRRSKKRPHSINNDDEE